MQSIESLEIATQAKLSQLESTLTSLDDRVTAMNGGIRDQVRAMEDGFDEKLRGLEDRFGERLKSIEERFTRIETVLEKLLVIQTNGR